MDSTIKSLQEQVDALRAENEALKNPVRKDRILTWKVSDKGAISIYGLGRFPVTLYFTQLTKLAASMNEIVAFAEANKDVLAMKPTKVSSKAA